MRNQMKKRLALAVIAGAALTGATTGAQAVTTMSGGSWGCVVLDLADKSVCVRDPLPDRLPDPSAPSAPTVG